MPKDKIVEIAKRLGETTGREEILFLFHQISPQTVLEYMDVWASHFDACKHHYDGKTHFYTVHHDVRSEEHTSELQSQSNLVCRLLLEKKKQRPGRPAPPRAHEAARP